MSIEDESELVPVPTDVELSIKAGAQVSPAALEALDVLARELADDDVSGFRMMDVIYCMPRGGSCLTYTNCPINGACTGHTCRIAG